MERGIEASDGGNLRQQLIYGPDSGKCRRQVKRREVDDGAEVSGHLRIYAYRCGVPRSTVHDPVTDSLDILHRPHGGDDFGLGDFEVAPAQDLVVVTDHAYFERARPGVDDEYAQLASAARSSRERRERPGRTRACTAGGAGVRRPSPGARGRPSSPGTARDRSRPSPGETGRGRSA